jgi:predicted nucleic acid-binding Zn ribbon protein
MKKNKPTRTEKTSPLSEIIDSSRKLQWLGVVDEQRSLEIYKCWEEAAGPFVARHAKPVRVKNNVLILSVRSPAWLQELSLLKPELLANFSRLMGDKAPADLKLKLAETA